MTDLAQEIRAGESETLEFKRSTALLNRAGETLCAFLNGQGGKVVIGVSDAGEALGQEVSDKTRREIAAMLDRFEPPAPIVVSEVGLPSGEMKLIVLTAPSQDETRPFTFDGRAYQRVQTTTSVMPQERYDALLLERSHARRRWENQPAVDVTLEDLDREEVLRTRDAGVRQRRISAETSTDVGDILDRLGLRRAGVVTQAAQMLYGTRFLPDYPQAMLKMGRFRGSTVTGDILDNRQEHLHAFAIVREAMAWLDRTLPLAAHFPPGQILREDRLPVPPDALREVLLNAVMHRDYSQPGGYVAIAVFDDRIEVRSVGALPRGVTAASLLQTHQSVLRNPLIAEAFHRTGAVEIWGRGTNRVLEACRRYGIAPPTFEESGGSVVVTFAVKVGPDPAGGDQVGTKLGPRLDQVQVLEFTRVARSLAEIMTYCGRANRTKFRDQVLRGLLEAGWLEMTLPDKPRSSLQKYRTSESGKRLLDGA